MLRIILLVFIVINSTYSFAGDLEDNNISISVSGNTTVLSEQSRKFKVKDTKINGINIEEDVIKNKLKINALVNSVYIDCATVRDCANGKEIHIKSDANATLSGGGAINSVIIHH